MFLIVVVVCVRLKTGSCLSHALLDSSRRATAGFWGRRVMLQGLISRDHQDHFFTLPSRASHQNHMNLYHRKLWDLGILMLFTVYTVTRPRKS